MKRGASAGAMRQDKQPNEGTTLSSQEWELVHRCALESNSEPDHDLQELLESLKTCFSAGAAGLALFRDGPGLEQIWTTAANEDAAPNYLKLQTLTEQLARTAQQTDVHCRQEGTLTSAPVRTASGSGAAIYVLEAAAEPNTGQRSLMILAARQAGRLIDTIQTPGVLGPAQRLLRALLEASPEPTALVNMATRQLAAASPSFRQLAGLEPDAETTTAQLIKALAMTDQNGTAYTEATHPLRRLLLRGEPIRPQQASLQQWGQTGPVRITGLLIPAGGTTPQLALLVIKDLRPVDRTERVYQSMMTMAGRQIRAALAALYGQVNLTLAGQREDQGAAQRFLLNQFNDGVEQINAIIRNLLDEPRPSDQLPRIQTTSTEVSELLKATQAVFLGMMPGREVDVVQNAPGVSLPADRQRLPHTLAALLATMGHSTAEADRLLLEAEQQEDHLFIWISTSGSRRPPPLTRSQPATWEMEEEAENLWVTIPLCHVIIDSHGGRLRAAPSAQGRDGLEIQLPINPGQQQGRASRPALRAADADHQSYEDLQDARILILRQEPGAATEIESWLSAAGLTPTRVAAPSEISGLRAEREYELAILATGNVTQDTADLLSMIQDTSTRIIVSGNPPEDRLIRELYEAGADSFLPLPQNSANMLMQVTGTLRNGRANSRTGPRAYEYRDLRIDYASRTATLGQWELKLSRTEYKVLDALARNAGHTLNHDELLDQAWGPEVTDQAQLVYNYIKRLRTHLGDDARRPQYIKTVTGQGYRMERPDDHEETEKNSAL